MLPFKHDEIWAMCKGICSKKFRILLENGKHLFLQCAKNALQTFLLKLSLKTKETLSLDNNPLSSKLFYRLNLTPHNLTGPGADIWWTLAFTQPNLFLSKWDQYCPHSYRTSAILVWMTSEFGWTWTQLGGSWAAVFVVFHQQPVMAVASGSTPRQHSGFVAASRRQRYSPPMACFSRCLSSWLTPWTPAAVQRQSVLFYLMERLSATSSHLCREENTHCIEDQAGLNVEPSDSRVQRADV